MMEHQRSYFIQLIQSIDNLVSGLHFCRYAIFSSSISFWLPSIGIVYFYIEASTSQVLTSTHKYFYIEASTHKDENDDT